MRIAIGKDINNELKMRIEKSVRINPFIVAIGQSKKWIEIGIMIGHYKKCIGFTKEYYKKLNKWVYTLHLPNKTRRYHFVTRLFTLAFYREVRW